MQAYNSNCPQPFTFHHYLEMYNFSQRITPARVSVRIYGSQPVTNDENHVEVIQQVVLCCSLPPDQPNNAFWSIHDIAAGKLLNLWTVYVTIQMSCILSC